jgi:hypothetical protein
MAQVTTSMSGAITALFATVTTVATQASRSVNTLAAGLDMLDSYVDTARTNQRISSKLSADDFLENIIQQSTLDQARKEQAIAKQLATDLDLKNRFTTIELRKRALFTETTP